MFCSYFGLFSRYSYFLLLVYNNAVLCICLIGARHKNHSSSDWKWNPQAACLQSNPVPLRHDGLNLVYIWYTCMFYIKKATQDNCIEFIAAYKIFSYQTFFHLLLLLLLCIIKLYARNLIPSRESYTKISACRFQRQRVGASHE